MRRPFAAGCEGGEGVVLGTQATRRRLLLLNRYNICISYSVSVLELGLFRSDREQYRFTGSHHLYTLLHTLLYNIPSGIGAWLSLERACKSVLFSVRPKTSKLYYIRPPWKGWLAWYITYFTLQQEGSLCAQHCLNALLQGNYFTAIDLATLGQQLDDVERRTMAEAGTTSEEYQKFMQVCHNIQFPSRKNPTKTL